MSQANGGATRNRVERNIYTRTRADGSEYFEIGYRDSTGKQRWQKVEGGIMAARAARDDLLGRKGRGERVQPNPKLRFNDAADAWLNGQVASLRPRTRETYEYAVRHIQARFGTRRLDAITADDAAGLVRDLRAEGKAEATNDAVRKAGSRVYKFAARRLGWNGVNPFDALERSERPKPGSTGKRRIFTSDELAQTIRACGEPWRTLFAVAAVTGGRLSEVLGLVWEDLDLADPWKASVRFAYQVDRAGRRVPLKTEQSRRTVEIPRGLAVMLLELKLASPLSGPSAFVFASRSGRALGQRNVSRVLRQAQQRATVGDGRPTFPELHDLDMAGKPRRIERGELPSFHGFRHTFASLAISEGDSAEEVSWQLGHKNSTVTRTVYIQEIKSAEHSIQRRERMAERYGPVFRSVTAASAD